MVLYFYAFCYIMENSLSPKYSNVHTRQPCVQVSISLHLHWLTWFLELVFFFFMVNIKLLSLCCFNLHSSVDECSYIGIYIISNYSVMNFLLLSFIQLNKELPSLFYWIAKYVHIFKVRTVFYSYISCNFICFSN